MIPEGLECCLGQRQVLLRPRTGVDGRYLFYALQSRFVKEQIAWSDGTGSTVSNIRIPVLKAFEIPRQEYETQIADNLASIDEKIELNRRQNRTLEAIAQTLFKHWFVDFEFPDENGNPYKSSGGAMQPSELGEIPAGWKIGCIGYFVEHKKRSVNPASTPDTSFHHFSIPNFDADSDPKVELGSTIQSNKYIVEENSILVSKLNPRFPRIWAVLELPGPGPICSTEFQVLVPQKCTYAFVFCLLKSAYVKSEMINRVSGTSGSHQRINPDDLLSIEAPIPQIKVVEKFDEAVISLIKKQEVNLAENKTLANLRDTLFPKLMSGEIRVA